MLIVYRQDPPIQTVVRNSRGEPVEVWGANLVKVGEVQTWEQAKALTPAPVVEVKAAGA